MKDDRGLYYYPSMQTHDVRMYVRETPDGDIEFRMWHKDMPHVWETHEWIPIDVVKAAAVQYGHPDRNPMGLYDLEVAKRLIREDRVHLC
ncbi:hypothetical protein GGQ74_002987 [Desulfobaculum xiamenense]|uniref:Uncharacterized protein n=1 Tax=Desulfobaculum xiamenense TaxID=995050 RepID=A0A846QQM9_9BACT|nr:hypothetical protein [Desulfobaculum xiamenense]NJB69290.1 hypothetical protein [Desulfobaculum xiamenense]